jgi:hypothetical protein
MSHQLTIHQSQQIFLKELNKMLKLLDIIEITVDLTNKSQLVTHLIEEVEPVECNIFILFFIVTDQEKMVLLKEDSEQLKINLSDQLNK